MVKAKSCKTAYTLTASILRVRKLPAFDSRLPCAGHVNCVHRAICTPSNLHSEQSSFSLETVGLSKSFVVKMCHSHEHFAESGLCWQSVSGVSSVQVANSIAGDIQ